MAQSLQTLRNSKIVGLHGRAVGIDKDGYLVGPPSVKRAVQDLTTASTGTTLNAYGVIVARVGGTATTAAGGVFILPNPIPGVAIDIVRHNTSQAATAGSTAVAFLRGSTAFYIESSGGSTQVAVLLANNAGCRLLGVSTAAYALQITGSTAGVLVTGTS